MQNNPRITVISICYNVESVIEKTMVSVLKQTFEDMEYIIIDGASKDKTVEIVKKVITEYPDRKIRMYSEPDRGIYDAMNKGIGYATGEWLIMMNAGDIFADSKVLENVFLQDIPTGKSFLYSNSICIQPDKSFLIGITSFDKGELLHQCIIYKKALHEEHGLYIVTDKIIISDYLFFIRIPKEEVLKIDTIICIFEGGGVSQQFRSSEYAICADYVFRRRTFFNMFFLIFRKRMQMIIPIQMRLFVKKRIKPSRFK